MVMRIIIIFLNRHMEGHTCFHGRTHVPCNRICRTNKRRPL